MLILTHELFRSHGSDPTLVDAGIALIGYPIARRLDLFNQDK